VSRANSFENLFIVNERLKYEHFRGKGMDAERQLIRKEYSRLEGIGKGEFNDDPYFNDDGTLSQSYIDKFVARLREVKAKRAMKGPL
jgi:hypothetical protein